MPLTRRATSLAVTKRPASPASPSAASPPSRKKKASTPSPKRTITVVTPSKLSSRLFSLADDDQLLLATLVCRPSARNRSPYVADIQLDNETTTAICHVPSLDLGGKCRPGARLAVKPARDRQGNPVAATAVGKFGTPKCQYIAQLLYVDESPLSADYQSVWMAAHPSLGERIAEQWLQQGRLDAHFDSPIVGYQKQVTLDTTSTGIRRRFDFVAEHADGTWRILEVKTVVDTDYSANAPPPANVPCQFLSSTQPYRRTAIFPWGKSKQKTPQGETVVSARAIEHVRHLTQYLSEYATTILLVVVRSDAQAFRPNHEACPTFARVLREAHEAGVQVLAKRVRWGAGEDLGVCYDDKVLPIVWPNVEK